MSCESKCWLIYDVSWEIDFKIYLQETLHCTVCAHTFTWNYYLSSRTLVCSFLSKNSLDIKSWKPWSSHRSRTLKLLLKL